MAVIVPAENTIGFWFDESTREALHGTPADAVRKVRVFELLNMLDQGIEIFLMPGKLESV